MTRRLPKRISFPSALLAAGLLLAGAAVLPAQQPGSLDPTFALNGGDPAVNPVFLPAQFNFTPFNLAVQPAGDGTNRLIVGGDNNTLFRVFLENTPSLAADGSPVLNPDGSRTPVIFTPGQIDQLFLASPNRNNGFGADGRIVYSLAIQQLADGSPRVLVGGLFGNTSNKASVLNKKELNFIRLRPNGAVESISADPDAPGANDPLSAFNANLGAGANDSVLAILPRTTRYLDANGLPEAEGRILLGGQFQRFNTVDRGRLVQLNPDGTQDQGFNANLGSGASSVVFTLAEAVNSLTGQANGQVYVCGDFDSFNGKGAGKLVRLNADGTLDTAFAPKIQGRAIAVAVQADGKVLVGGDLDTVNGQAVNNVARLNLDGTSDPTFLTSVNVSDPKNIPPTSVYVIRVQADGKILIGGNYQQINGATRRYLGRLLADGTLDFTFDATNALVRPDAELFRSPNAVQAIALDPTFAPNAAAGFTSRLIVSQTRADRKQEPGDNGFFPFAIHRLNTDEATVSSPALPVVSLTAINGQIIEPAADGTGSQFGRLRVTRFGGDLTQALTVRVKATAGSSAAYNGDYQVEELVRGEVVTPFDGAQFTVTLPQNVSSTDLIIIPTNPNLAQDRAVTFKVKGQVSGGSAYTRDPATQQATVAVFFNRG